MEKRGVAVGFLSAVVVGGGLVGGFAWANSSHPDVDTYEGGNVSEPVSVPESDYAVDPVVAEATPSPEPEPTVEPVVEAPAVEADPVEVAPAPVEQAPAPVERAPEPAPQPDPAPALPPTTVEVGPTGAGNADMAGNAASDD